ncbi:hypothetical protein COO60DRAFT_25190 [Scenedesmus sp. NREL 46B-D3]|nr:hypothetical protein COO60DRAFT_25190 [Scenedesmus sp. NREL 46B-D3]
MSACWCQSLPAACSMHTTQSVQAPSFKLAACLGPRVWCFAHELMADPRVLLLSVCCSALQSVTSRVERASFIWPVSLGHLRLILVMQCLVELGALLSMALFAAVHAFAWCLQCLSIQHRAAWDASVGNMCVRWLRYILQLPAYIVASLASAYIA